MKNVKRLSAVLAGLLATVFLSTAVHSLRSRRPSRTARRPVVGVHGQGMFLPRADPASMGVHPNVVATDPDTPVFPVDVDPNLSLDAAAQTLYDQMAQRLTGYATVPVSRTNYYAVFVNSRHYRIIEWQGTLTDVTPAAGGNVVTVGVNPALQTPTWISNDYTEQYFVSNNGAIQYLGFADPLGLAGRYPPEMEEY